MNFPIKIRDAAFPIHSHDELEGYVQLAAVGCDGELQRSIQCLTRLLSKHKRKSAGKSAGNIRVAK